MTLPLENTTTLADATSSPVDPFARESLLCAPPPHTELRALCLSAATQIVAECRGGDGNRPLAGCGESLIESLGLQASLVVELFDHDVFQPLPPPPVDAPATGSDPRARGDKAADGADDGDTLRPKAARLLLVHLDGLISLSYSHFRAYIHSPLPLCWRQLYTDLSILKFVVLFLCSAAAKTGRGQDDQVLRHMVESLDLALILAGAGGETRGRPWIDKALSLLERAWQDAQQPQRRLDQDCRDGSLWASHPSFSTTPTFSPPVSRPVARVQAMGMPFEAFQAYMDRPPDRTLGPAPLVISGLQDGWPARTSRPWCKPAYLLSRTFGGRRLVPVEVGRSYVDEGWAQQIISFGDFLRKYMDPAVQATSIHSTPAVGYLAQHQLFAQLPQLRADIAIPDYCWTAPPPSPGPELEEPQLNAWFGPAGTITPLHTDPYHNLLAQVVGSKYVRLYPPHETRRMRPRPLEDGVDMANTSLFQVERMERWPTGVEGRRSQEDLVQAEHRPDEEEERRRLRDEFARIPYYDCILEPGDTLYIPVGWWHYVMSTTPSFSVSFWWN